MSETLRVLILDDNAADAELIVAQLEASGLEVEARRVLSEHAFRSALSGWRPDVVLSDHGLAGFSALDALSLQKAVAPTIPFIVVSGALDDRVSVASLRAGADDLISKGALEHLGPAIERSLSESVALRKLSPRQVEVFGLIVRGHTTAAVAEVLGLGVKTVQTHRSEFMKLGSDLSGTARGGPGRDRGGGDRLAPYLARREFKDADTAGHIERVGRFAGMLAEAAGLAPGEVERIRHAAPDVPVIAMSGGGLFDEGMLLDSAGALGAVTTLEKTFEPEQLERAIVAAARGGPS